MRAAFMAVVAASALAAAPALRVDLRTRVEAFKGTGEWQEVRFTRDFPVKESAILICDMWDRHWCAGATRRVDEMVKRMAPVVEKARAAGLLIIHAPSDVMDFYKDTSQRQRMLAIEKIAPPEPLPLPDPPLPIDDRSGGCDTGETVYKAWTRQHPGIRIAEEDFVSDKGDEIYSLLRRRGVKTLFIMGVHTNMCVLNRSFAIKRMTKLGIQCVLVRDLTDAMYDPRDRPYVSHQEGTELVIRYIESHWCPTALSTDLAPR
ncbi:MAG TPA: isochorismatase family protein [Bryobacteraceae bacterium]|nr:isochorismatase family protein [Bryobacteraceae bacterium]